ncbi:hypothetical protein [Zavarzinia sp. CC-PAN008]|uniref:hypothetical protein n=1 Tax=Zavarzinia sp. CC-PAN008 TaxID=3243332 RepID=UPI003F747236
MMSIEQPGNAYPSAPATGQDSPDPFDRARDHVVNLLINHVLADSYFAFQRNRKPYPFVTPERLLPGSGRPGIEHREQNTAFLILIDGKLPDALNKHFRLRSSNMVTAENLKRIAPFVPLSGWDPSHGDLLHGDAETMLKRLLAVDYALLAERDGGPLTLTHLHVKVERLTDNAIKELAQRLGFIDRRLFEHGEAFVDALEEKYYEYYGFPAHSSGRKSAAAMAAQLLGGAGLRYAVIVSNQDDARLTVLETGDRISQYMLLRLDREESARLRALAEGRGLGDGSAFVVLKESSGQPLVIYRTTLRHSRHARCANRARALQQLAEPWLEVAEEHLIPVPGRIPAITTALPFSYNL